MEDLPCFVTSKKSLLKFVREMVPSITDENKSDVQTKKWKVYRRKRSQVRTNIVESTMTTHQGRDNHVDSATAK